MSCSFYTKKKKKRQEYVHEERPNYLIDLIITDDKNDNTLPWKAYLE